MGRAFKPESKVRESFHCLTEGINVETSEEERSSNNISAENWVMELWEIWNLLITHVFLLFALLGYFSFWCFSSSVSNTHIMHH